MAFFDLPLDQLKSYRPERSEPADFDAFWADTLAQARTHPLDARFQPVDFGLQTIETWDVTFNGYAGQPVKGWLLMPRQRKEPLPCVVEYIGYGGGRGIPFDWLVWSSAGYAHFIMDTRGQGSSWRPGDTADIPDGANPFHPGFMTQGVLSPKTYYYRRVFTDGVRAVEAARSNPAVRGDRIALSGASQGGGITVAVSGLAPDVAASMPDVPFLCHYRRAATLVDSMPYGEIINYLRVHRDKDQIVWKTLSYFDGVNFATRATAPALFSTGLMDQTCPPSTVFAAYNYWAGAKKDIRVWTYNMHNGGDSFQTLEKIKFLKALWS